MKAISRRSLLTTGIKSAAAFVALNHIRVLRPVMVAADEFQDVNRFKPALQLLDQFVARHMNELGAPGLTLAIANRDGLLREAHYGFADVKTGTKVGPQTLFQIGSISKSFVAIALLQLVDEGELDLEKPVNSYLPWLKVDSAFPPFNTHHLLSHTAGLSAVPLLTRVAAKPLRTGTAPGTRFVYSNIGYVLLGLLLETLDKRRFADSLRGRVLERLGMSASAPVITNDIRGRLAVGYGPTFDDRPFPFRGKLSEAPWLEITEAAGSIAATAKDMGAYLQMLLNQGRLSRGRLLSEKAFELFVRPVIKAPFRGEDASYTYGLWTSTTNGHTLLRHTGGMISFSSAMYADVTGGFAAFASVNARLSGYRPVAVTRYALDLLNAAAREADLPDAPPPPPPPTLVRNAADYAGTFNSPDRSKVIMVAESERLVLEHNGRRVMLEQVGQDRFIVKDPEFELFLLGFGRDKDNAVVEAFHGADWWTNEKYSGAKSFDYPAEWNAFVGSYRSDSPWYGSMRIVVRKGRILLGAEQPLVQVSPAVFRPEDEGSAERIVFDTVIDAKAQHLSFSGIDFYRSFTR